MRFRIVDVSMLPGPRPHRRLKVASEIVQDNRVIIAANFQSLSGTLGNACDAMASMADSIGKSAAQWAPFPYRRAILPQ